MSTGGVDWQMAGRTATPTSVRPSATPSERPGLARLPRGACPAAPGRRALQREAGTPGDARGGPASAPSWTAPTSCQSVGRSPSARLANSSLLEARTRRRPNVRPLGPRLPLPLARVGRHLRRGGARQEHVRKGPQPRQRRLRGVLRTAQERVLPLTVLGTSRPGSSWASSRPTSSTIGADASRSRRYGSVRRSTEKAWIRLDGSKKSTTSSRFNFATEFTLS